ncbi:hypothetical protein VNO80_15963 [Phaseolus coccineus]|uniref:Uncharacterized protein n=1 Tax=Phaseolus coccineus TaxID=3886 RepID=A0AAN9R7G8_PHACN
MHGAWSQPTTTSSLQLTHLRIRKTPHHETVHPPFAVGKWANGNIKLPSVSIARYGKEHPCCVRAQTSLPVLTRFQPISSAFLLPNTAREDGFDREATGMSQCLPSDAHVGVLFAWPKTSPDHTRPEFQPISSVWFFNSPRSSKRIMTRRWLKENPRNEIVSSL